MGLVQKWTGKNKRMFVLLVWKVKETMIHTKHKTAKRKGKTKPENKVTKSYPCHHHRVPMWQEASPFPCLQCYFLYVPHFTDIYLDNLQSNLCTYSACPVAIRICALNIWMASHCKMQMKTGQYFSNIPARWRKFVVINGLFRCYGDNQQRKTQE